MFDNIVGSIGGFSYKNRKIISILALVLFVAVVIVQSQLIIEYSYAEESLVTDIFPQDDTVVIVYDNKDEKNIQNVIKYLEKDEHVTEIQAYGNTLGAQMTADDMASMMGIPKVFVNTLLYMNKYGMNTTGLTLVDFTSFLSSDDFLNNEMFSSMIDENSKSQIGMMKTIVDALASDEEYSADEIAAMLGIEKQLVQSVFYIAQMKALNIFNITPMFWASVAEALGMESDMIETIFRVKPVKTLKFMEFVDIISEVSSFAQGIMDKETRQMLSTFKNMADSVKNNSEITTDDLSAMFSLAGDSSMLTDEMVPLIYIMARSNTMDMSQTTVALYDFFIFLSEDVLNNEMFSSFFDDSVASQFAEAKITMEDGKAQLIGKDHSRMIIYLDYPLESPEIKEFYINFTEKLDSSLSGEYYLVGASAMSYEVEQSFSKEFLIISIVTAIVVFAVVWFTFRKFFLSLLLIGVIECAVFAMMSVMVIIELPMYFVALIIVQCILMGSMIDYGILFTTYYMEVRREYSIEKALPEVMKRATHAILTSSLIIVLVTLICGVFMSGAVASILKTLGIGALCAILLILFVLPSLLAIFDKHVVDTKVADEELLEIEE